jgi:nitroreductase
MEILELIKKRTTIRKYRNKMVPIKTVKKIIAAGIWSSAIHRFQPWKFIVISNKILKRKISNSLLQKSRVIGDGPDKLLFLTSNTIANAPQIILVYNQQDFRNIAFKLFKIKKSYIGIAEHTEIQAISGAIQNMILVASKSGIASCWNTMPLFCEKEINKLLKTNDRLVAILTLGYPAEEGGRSARKEISEKTLFIN